MQILRRAFSRSRCLERGTRELSRAARLRLSWMGHYQQHGQNATFACRHLGIGQATFYGWKGRYDPENLFTLEDRSHRPHRRRQPSWFGSSASRIPTGAKTNSLSCSGAAQQDH